MWEQDYIVGQRYENEQLWEQWAEEVQTSVTEAIGHRESGWRNQEFNEAVSEMDKLYISKTREVENETLGKPTVWENWIIEWPKSREETLSKRLKTAEKIHPIRFCL